MLSWLYKKKCAKLQAASCFAWESVDGAVITLAPPGKYEYQVAPIINCKQSQNICVVVYLADTCIQILPVSDKHVTMDITGVVDTEHFVSATLRFALECSTDYKQPVIADVVWNAKFRNIVN